MSLIYLTGCGAFGMSSHGVLKFLAERLTEIKKLGLVTVTVLYFTIHLKCNLFM